MVRALAWNARGVGSNPTGDHTFPWQNWMLERILYSYLDLYKHLRNV